MKSHLRICPDCEEEYALLQRSAHLVRTLEPKTAPAGFNQSLRKRLLAESAPPWYRGQRFVLAAAASVALLLVSWPWWLSYPLGQDFRLATETSDHPEPGDFDVLLQETPGPQDAYLTTFMGLEATLRVSDVDSALLSLGALSSEPDGEQDFTRTDGGYRIVLHVPDASLDRTLAKLEEMGSIAWVPKGRGELIEHQYSRDHDLHDEYLEAAQEWVDALRGLSAAREAGLPGDQLAEHLVGVARARASVESVLTASSGVTVVIHLIED